MQPRTASLLAFVSFGCAAASIALAFTLALVSPTLRGDGGVTASIVFGLLAMGTFFPLLPLTDLLPAPQWARTLGVAWVALMGCLGAIQVVFPDGGNIGASAPFLPLAAIWLAATSWGASSPRAVWGRVSALAAVAYLVLLAVAFALEVFHILPMRLAMTAAQVPFAVWLLLLGREFQAAAEPDPSIVRL